MRLYLAVAVLMLAFVAYTEAQDDTVEQRFAKFTEQMADFGRRVAEKARTTVDRIRTSELGISASTWTQEQVERIKAKFDELTQ